ncbi:ATP-binding protein [Streptomyces cavernae]|uniref:ATP-binding protein n=1 Tax=Streptomyces cavernae TaxID=2259034 RepID=UPI000FEB7C0B|nr:ATP-binding protein [Streptomyces cavernae]
MSHLRPHTGIPEHVAPLPPACSIVGSASAGARVVLYTCAIDSAIATRTLTVLRAFASAQGWTAVHEAYDLAPLGTPRHRRTGWRAIEQALICGDATGFVAPSEQEIACHPADRAALRGWIIDQSAFAVYPRPPAPSAGPASVWSRSFALVPGSVRQLLGAARSRLAIRQWSGDIDSAVEVLARLAFNAVVHAQPANGTTAQMHVHLSFTDRGDLVIDVEDPSPGFPDAPAALRGDKGRGLREARQLGARLEWFLAADGRRKTVRATLPARQVSA